MYSVADHTKALLVRRLARDGNASQEAVSVRAGLHKSCLT